MFSLKGWITVGSEGGVGHQLGPPEHSLPNAYMPWEMGETAHIYVPLGFDCREEKLVSQTQIAPTFRRMASFSAQ